MKQNSIAAFFALLRAGLWEKDVSLSQYGEFDYAVIMKLAVEQSVVGLVTAGLEHVIDVKVPQEWALQFICSTLQIEQRCKAMNDFVAKLVSTMRNAGIYALLIKGQGVAQCYEKPLWRSCGDVDLFLDDENYERAKSFLIPLADSCEKEGIREKHMGMTINGIVIELHGRLYGGLSSKIEKVLDDIYYDTFYDGHVSSWDNGGTRVFILSKENNVFYVFTHILQHFYKGGVGLRQICDWIRLLKKCGNNLDEHSLRRMMLKSGLMTEWYAFCSLAVKTLGTAEDIIPMYSHDNKWVKKGDMIRDFVLMSGNFGQNRDMEYLINNQYYVRKIISMKRRYSDFKHHFQLFPLDSLRYFSSIIYNGMMSVYRSE